MMPIFQCMKGIACVRFGHRLCFRQLLIRRPSDHVGRIQRTLTSRNVRELQLYLVNSLKPAVEERRGERVLRGSLSMAYPSFLGTQSGKSWRSLGVEVQTHFTPAHDWTLYLLVLAPPAPLVRERPRLYPTLLQLGLRASSLSIPPLPEVR